MFRKITYILSFILLLNLPSFAGEDLNWFTNINKAKTTSEEIAKPILMCFAGSDWCKPCIILKNNILESDTFAIYAKQELIMLKVDFPRLKKNRLSTEQTKHNESLAEQYNKEGHFPHVVILNSDGTIITQFNYWNKTPEELISFLNSVLKP